MPKMPSNSTLLSGRRWCLFVAACFSCILLSYAENVMSGEEFAAAFTLQQEPPLEFSDILPENPRMYDKMEPPKPGGNATIVDFHVTILSLDSIDESSMTFAADIFFSQTWLDYRLRLPENMTASYRLLPTAWLQEMWRPDAFFKNAKKVTFQDITIPNHYIWLFQDKRILYMVKLTLILSCTMNFRSYPHDTQECSMKIESLSHKTTELVFQWARDVPLVVDDIELPQLDLKKNVTGDCTQWYSTGNFTCLEVKLSFKRRLGYYVFHTYIPTCLIVIMSWISFWIRPEAVPARVTLGVTSLLTLSTQHANSQKGLPPVSYMKAIDGFMAVCTIFVFSSLMEYALVNTVMGDEGGEESALKKGFKNILISTRNTPLSIQGTSLTTETDSRAPNNNHCPSLSAHQQQQHQQQQQQQKPQVALPPRHVQQQLMLASQQRQQQQLTRSQSMMLAVSRANHYQRNVSSSDSQRGNSRHAAQIAAQVHQHQLPCELPEREPAVTMTIRRTACAVHSNRRELEMPSVSDNLNLNQLNAILPDTSYSSSGVADSRPSATPPVENGRLPLLSTLHGKMLDLKRMPKTPPSPTAAQLRRDRAIFIDRTSRIIFPVLFFFLNIIYWVINLGLLDQTELGENWNND